tara:strand:+ start:1610 stop:1795 length:186 start_codon:yes stop_codon:yes gene_type:complete
MLNDLPEDVIIIIYEKLHKFYMKTLRMEIYDYWYESIIDAMETDAESDSDYMSESDYDSDS